VTTSISLKRQIHPASATVLIAVDALWTLADWNMFSWVFTIPLSFLSVVIPTFVIQKRLQKDTFGRALLTSIVLGILAAIPTPIMGTAVGTFILIVSGLKGWKVK
jgi:hypothetical protein